MASCEAWDIVRVPFPYAHRPIRQWRPALVIAARTILDEHGLIWILMITSAENRGWSGDVLISDHAAAGLPAASLVRTAKIATIEDKDIESVGSLPLADRMKVTALLSAELALVG
jgi:mRNA interferase MazF